MHLNLVITGEDIDTIKVLVIAGESHYQDLYDISIEQQLIYLCLLSM